LNLDFAFSLIYFLFLLWYTIDKLLSTLLKTFAALNVNSTHDSLIPPVKKVCIHPPSASRIQLPDGRHMAYHERGVPANRARFSLIAPHSFLSSRLAGKKKTGKMFNPLKWYPWDSNVDLRLIF
jgi:hypothetical protein